MGPVAQASGLSAGHLSKPTLRPSASRFIRNEKMRGQPLADDVGLVAAGTVDGQWMMEHRVARMHGHCDGLTWVEALSFACVVELENGRLISVLKQAQAVAARYVHNRPVCWKRFA